MDKQSNKEKSGWRGWILAAALSLAAIGSAAALLQPTALAQEPASATQKTNAQTSAQGKTQSSAESSALQTQAQKSDQPKAANHISPEQARQLFSLVDQLIKFSSEETGLPIKSSVKRQITSRAAVESYIEKKFDEDQSAKRLQRDEIVLKKFGLLDRDFALKPFLLALLKEQIAAYYDFKSKTVYMLDWVDIEEQKPVLAHELTHALQDQHTSLEKWSDQTPDNLSLDSSDDTSHLVRDEMDTARQAIVEGQATAVMMDYILKPMGKSLVKNPEIMDFVRQRMAESQDSPVLARAPLLLSESLLFPYREGLGFEQEVWMDQGQAAAFTGALDQPPTSSWEIINPREYEQRHTPAVPLLPNIHPLVDKLYKPYDIGQIGQLDLHILTELFGGDQAARDLTPAWDGGLYWAGERRDAKTSESRSTDKAPSADSSEPGPFAGEAGARGSSTGQSGTSSIAFFYLSAWKNTASAQAFTRLYEEELGRKYSGVQLLDQTTDGAASSGRPNELGGPASQEQVYSTSEGPVVITIRGKLVFVAESFPLELARKLTALILDAQGTGAMRLAQAAPSASLTGQTAARSLDSALGEGAPGVGAPGPGSPRTGLRPWGGDPDSGTWESKNPNRFGTPEPASRLPEGFDSEDRESLTANLIRFLSDCGVMKTAVEAAVEAGK
jgi:hypothetical protein